MPQLRRLAERKPIERVRVPERDLFFKKFASTRDAFYNAYKKTPKLVNLVLTELNLPWAQIVSISKNSRVPAIKLIVKHISNSKSGFVKSIDIPNIGKVLFIIIEQDNQQKNIDHHERAHTITDGYFNTRYVTGGLELLIHEFEMHLLSEIISDFSEKKSELYGSYYTIRKYVFAHNELGLEEQWKEYNRLTNLYDNLVEVINEAKTKLPKVAIIRMLRKSTFETAADNLRKEMALEKYKYN